uniref:Uncharacterized protein n=1 Tax=Setaria viridis TaxID=4556 RepID=A0A4U6ULK6_SETVI|nr:hypothetical protein SEVIR_5G218600v2 [Setaria viridis]
MFSFFSDLGAWIVVSFPAFLELRMGVAGQVKASGDAKSMCATADRLLPRISCSLPTFGVRPSFWMEEVGGSLLLCAARRADGNRQVVPRKKKYSRVLFVISWLLRLLRVKEGCTVPFLI